jgi:hypothetical protein
MKADGSQWLCARSLRALRGQKPPAVGLNPYQRPNPQRHDNNTQEHIHDISFVSLYQALSSDSIEFPIAYIYRYRWFHQHVTRDSSFDEHSPTINQCRWPTAPEACSAPTIPTAANALALPVSMLEMPAPECIPNPSYHAEAWVRSGPCVKSIAGKGASCSPRSPPQGWRSCSSSSCRRRHLLRT